MPLSPLNSKLAISSVTLSGNDVSYVTDVTVKRSANVITILIHNIQNLPAGEYEDICLIPSAYSAKMDYVDVVCATSTNASPSFIILRFRVTGSGKLQVYNYSGVSFSNNNIELRFTYVADS